MPQLLGSNSVAVGETSRATGTNSTALGADAVAGNTGATAVGAGAMTTANNQVALGGAGSAVRIGDIDASTDAQSGAVDVVTVDANGVLGRQGSVTFSQFRSLARVVEDISMVSTAQFDALAGRVTSIEGQVNGLFDLADTVDRDASRGIASIAAQAAPHFPSQAGKTSYASNVAVYRGEVGVSAGLMHRFEGDFAITAGVTYAGGNSTSVRAGIAGEF